MHYYPKYLFLCRLGTRAEWALCKRDPNKRGKIFNISIPNSNIKRGDVILFETKMTVVT
jgi:hypothetical protein